LVELKDIRFGPGKKLADRLRKTREIGSQFGIDISNIVVLRNIVIPESREKALKDIINCIKEISEAGINVLNLVTAEIPEGMSEEEVWAILLDSFEKILKVAEENKVYLAVEAIGGLICRDYYTTRELMRRLPSDYLCITLDPSHYHFYKNDIPWCILNWGDKIKHVHVKDVVGVYGRGGIDFLFPILGEGALDWVTILKSLEKINYKGALSIEFESYPYYVRCLKENPVEAARISMQSMNSLWEAYVKSIPWEVK